MVSEVVIVPLYHNDYPFDVGIQFAKQLYKELSKVGVKVTITKGLDEKGDSIDELVSKIQNENPYLIILFVATWIEVPQVLDLLFKISWRPTIVWGLRMYYSKGKRESTGSLPGSCVLKGTLEALGYKFKYIVGMPKEGELINKVCKYLKVSKTIRKLSELRIGLVGYTSMGMYTGTFDQISIKKKFGTEIIHIDTSEVFDYINKIDEDKAYEVVKKWQKHYYIEKDVKVEELIMASKIYLAFKEIIKKYKLNAISVKCQYEFSKGLKFVPCVPLSVLADEGIICSCEGDIPLTLTMAILHFLTNEPIYYGDIVDIRDNRIYLSSCGFAPLSLAKSKNMGIGRHKYFFKGLRSGIILKDGVVTLARLGVKEGSYIMHVTYGVTTETELRQGLFPALEVELKGNIENFIENILSQHYAVAYGDLRNELRDFCSLMNIKYTLT